MKIKPAKLAAIFACIHFLNPSVSQAQATESFDVVIVSGSSGGIGAAIGAARLGASVALIEDTPVLGGMLSNGISNIDAFSYESLSGVFEEFRQEVKRHYAPLMDTDPVYLKKMPDKLKDRKFEANHIDKRSFQVNQANQGGTWEPKVADMIFKKMAAKYPRLKIFYKRYATGIIKDLDRICGVITTTDDGDERTFLGKVVIDATHEADIAAWGGVPYRVGREPRSALEPHAGSIFYFNDTGEILPGSTGRQDAAIVSYGLRLIVKNYKSDDGNAHILKNPPPGYDPLKYTASSFGGSPKIANGKVEMNINPNGNELQEINWSWPEANYKERKKLYEIYKNQALGFLYYVQHVNGKKHLGLANDEFRDNGNVPYRVFVREARRIEGEATMTEADINPFVSGNSLAPPFQTSSIAIGHYPIDAKLVRKKTDFSTPDKGEGDFFLKNAATAFQVPYGAIVPKNVDGLLVPVALSATHVAFSAVRMDPTWTATGQTAGIAAVLSIREGVDVRNVEVRKIQAELIKQKCKLVFYWDVPLDHPQFEIIQKMSIAQKLTGDANRDFHPDSLFTRADAAVLLARVFGLSPSVSNAHFKDVPYTHPAFREIETLFDHGALSALGIKPKWKEQNGYDAKKHSGFKQDYGFWNFNPDGTISGEELLEMIAVLKNEGVLTNQNQSNPTTEKLPVMPRTITRAAALGYLNPEFISL
ncbi:FAD-dependent oxidoreductase [Chitinophaga barathri]|uniref:FAD-dependent oxidoreductase n=1 Tax=Chitinophaga barathri TaxID=1647451 RepID=A0A3N4MHE0_9BACT|nr:FAD-dependent oxidoreductase [Chitinophaga barathri]RPD43008.1 FAD-dependent oxidoreductase [Chitinophaga barathri]